MTSIATRFALGTSVVAALFTSPRVSTAQDSTRSFRVIAFFTAKKDDAHISFVREAMPWFPKIAAQYHFDYDTTSNWSNLDSTFLSKYQVVVFLDTRPEDPVQRAVFQQYMEHGGAWMGFTSPASR